MGLSDGVSWTPSGQLGLGIVAYGYGADSSPCASRGGIYCLLAGVRVRGERGDREEEGDGTWAARASS
ncbi:hypothetical protein chiPu_0028428 [Chiloscyllium punctatum]|uniref:Uncharacterized protein n=1 Tax=Chiloscyllium punctatum TaxID=137246 RepID=A0A401TP22_CHIPU|nr:hypothetical protein [Chiloscyllium punctatum]